MKIIIKSKLKGAKKNNLAGNKKKHLMKSDTTVVTGTSHHLQNPRCYLALLGLQFT